MYILFTFRTKIKPNTNWTRNALRRHPKTFFSTTTTPTRALHPKCKMLEPIFTTSKKRRNFAYALHAATRVSNARTYWNAVELNAPSPKHRGETAKPVLVP